MGLRTWEFRIEKDRVGGVAILTLSGRLGQLSVHRLRHELAQPEPIGVVVDLIGVDYISGPGLAALQDAANTAEGSGRAFVLCGLEGSVRIAFELAGLLRTLRVESNRERAVAIAAGADPPPARHGN